LWIVQINYQLNWGINSLKTHLFIYSKVYVVHQLRLINHNVMNQNLNFNYKARMWYSNKIISFKKKTDGKRKYWLSTERRWKVSCWRFSHPRPNFRRQIKVSANWIRSILKKKWSNLIPLLLIFSFDYCLQLYFERFII